MGRVEVALFASQNAGGKLQAGAQFRTDRCAWHSKQAGERLPAFGKVFAHLPEVKERGAEAKSPLNVAGCDQEVECRAEVIML